MRDDHIPAETRRKIPEQHVHVSLSEPTIVFVTICTKSRERWLAQESVHHSLRETWNNAAAWLVGRYVIMPDHLHFFCAPNDLEVTIDTWITYWKRKFSRLQLIGTGPWQRSSWHHRLRRHESYSRKWEYVRENPVRAGLAETPDSWPYQGELNTLRW